MNTNDTTDLTRASVRQRLASLPRFRTSAILLVVLVVLLVGPSVAISSTIPTIYITAVERDKDVSLQTYNYPPNQDFVVTMGPMGSLGINGYYVTTINSGAGGSFTVNDLPIPPQLYGSSQIAIRLQSAQGYYSFNWFWNNTTGTDTGIGGTPGYTGIPTFGITSVVKDNKVIVHTHNFPAGQEFSWTMGAMGTRGVNGYIVKNAWPSGDGGYTDVELIIPPELYGHSQISVRAQTAHANPYYAYNWFWNTTADTTVTGEHGATEPHYGPHGGMPVVVPPATNTTQSSNYVYSGIPTFMICAVQQNNTVKIRTNNFPPNQDFLLSMGPMGTVGYGYPVVSFNSGAGGTFDKDFPIPSELYGHTQISIRAQTGHPWPHPYYAYNWFWNNNADVCSY